MKNRFAALLITLAALPPAPCPAQSPAEGTPAQSSSDPAAPPAAAASVAAADVAAAAESLDAAPPSGAGQTLDAATLASIEVRPDLCFREVDGQRLLADFLRPPGPGELPVLLVVHGGGWVAGDKSHIASHSLRIAAAGFAVLSINYRLAPAHPYPAPLEDVYAALRYIEQNAAELGVDRGRIGVWGYSAGGHLAALASVRPEPGTPRPVVCVAGGAPCDFTRIPPRSAALSAFLGGPRAERPEVYAAASPVTHATADDPPTFFINGDADLLVPHTNSLKLRRRLEEAGVATAAYTARFQGHMATFLNAQAVDAGIAFAGKYLKGE